MPIDNINSASTRIRDEIGASYASLLEETEIIQKHVAEQIEAWELSTRLSLTTEFPFFLQEEKLLDWNKQLQPPSIPSHELIHKAIDDYISFCEAIGEHANEKFWRNLFKPKNSKTAIAQKLTGDHSIDLRLLFEGWQKQMDKVHAEWELQRIETLRAALMEQLEKLLQLLQKLQEQLRSFGLDTGLLFDLSTGELTATDIQQFVRWAKYLAEDEGIQKLCDLLGKMRQIEWSDKIERVKTIATTEVYIPDANSREEIIGIRLGRDIEHALPVEFALLADPDTALLFDLKYVESALMCFDMQGMQNSHTHVETEEEHTIKENEKQGPMILCVDTSGSMNGMPETIAKAITLFLVTKAREQKRPCYLINFSTSIHTFDFGADMRMKDLLRFLKMSFHGGTDVGPALDHALHTMGQDEYKNADLLVISDFVMSELPKDYLERVEGQRLNGNKFHSLVVGSAYMTQRLQGIFDNEWIYDPHHGRIYELINFCRNVKKPLIQSSRSVHDRTAPPSF
jgi:uncharacterized protein with von Willebrand factor type A (vWA) domain